MAGRERGVKIVNLEVKCGVITANIDERLFHKKHTKPEGFSGSENGGDASLDASAMNQTSKSKSILPSLKKQILAFPDKVCYYWEFEVNICYYLRARGGGLGGGC